MRSFAPAFVILFLWNGSAHGQPTAQLLQKALYTEETDGDLPAAIIQYEAILVTAEQNVSVAAETLYRLGICHQKLGNSDEAAQSFQRVIDNYPAQDQWTQASLAQLRDLGRSTQKITVTQMPQNDALYGFHISADGTASAYFNAEGKLVFQDLISGETIEGIGNERVLNFILNSDGTRIAYSRRDPKTKENQIWVVKTASPRDNTLLHTSPNQVFVEDWHPKEDMIAIASFEDKRLILGTINVQDPKYIKVPKFKFLQNNIQNYPKNIQFHPDGTHMTFCAVSGDKQENDIYILELRNGESKKLVNHPANDTHPVWHPDGDYFIYQSDRQGGNGLFRQEMSGFQPQGTPLFLKHIEKSSDLLKVTRNGDFYYTTYFLGGTKLYMAFPDPNSSEAPESFQEIERRHMGKVRILQLSPDSQSLALYQWFSFSRRELNILDLSSGADYDVSTLLNMRSVNLLKWTDATTLAIGGQSKDGKQLVKVLNVETMNITSHTEFDLPQRLQWSSLSIHDEKIYFLTNGHSSDELIVYERNLKTGQQVEFANLRNPGVSPRNCGLNIKGMFIEYYKEEIVGRNNQHSLRRQSLVDGKELTLFSSPNSIKICSPWNDTERLGVLEKADSPVFHVMEYTETGANELFSCPFPSDAGKCDLWDLTRQLYFTRPSEREDDGSGNELWRLSGEDGSISKVNLPISRFDKTLILDSSDGNGKIFLQQTIKPQLSLWKMSNLPSTN